MLSKHRETGLATLLFVVLAVLFTWPLVSHMGTHVIGPFRGDNLEYVWKMWWVKHAVLDLGRSPLIQPDIYYPYGYRLAYGEITPIHTYLGLPLTALLGPVAAYNAFIMLSIVLSGLFIFLYVRRLTGSPAAGIVAGAIFAFCPYRMARIAGHLPLVDTQWIPLLFLFVDRFLDEHRPLDAILSGLAFAASALSSWYYGLALTLVLPVYLLVRGRKAVRTAPWTAWMRGGLAFVVVVITCVLPFLLPYRHVQQAGQATVPLAQAAFWSASLTDYWTPNPRHFMWGDWVRRHLTPFREELPYEFLVGWGLVSSILALYGWRRGRTITNAAWGWWTVVAFVLSLGPIFKLFSAVVPLPLPAVWAKAIQGALDGLGRHSLAGEPFLATPAGHIAIPLPALLLRWALPGLAGMRAWGRLAILATFGVAVWAGVGVAVFIDQEIAPRPSRWPARRRWGVTTLLAGLILFEFYTGPQTLIATGPRAVDKWLSARSTQTTIIQMPLAAALSGPQMYYTKYHGQRLASGYGTYLPILFEQRHPQLYTFPSNESLDALAEWDGGGIGYVLLDEADVPTNDPIWQAVGGQDRLEPVTVLDGVHVYRLR